MSLSAQLEHGGVVGWACTVREVHRKAELLVHGDRETTLGLGHLLPATVDEVLAALTGLGGRLDSSDRCYIDPAGIAQQAGAAGDRLRLACERGERVLFGTGHPAGPLALYIRLASELAARGAEVLEFAEGETFAIPDWQGRCAIRYVCGVACLYGAGNLLHTHDAEPMSYLFDTGPRPALVVGDHGFAGVGLSRGADAVALVDANDPALLLAWGRGLPLAPILCDDNRPPGSYTPLTEMLLSRLS